MPLRRAVALAAVVVPPLVLAAVGLTHPHVLTDASAHHWRDLHVGLLPIFPLLGLGPWLVVRSSGPVLAWVTAVLGYVYAAGYTALDVLAGIGAGSLQVANGGVGRDALFVQADRLAAVGTGALLVAALVASVVAVRRSVVAVPGVVLVLAAAWVFRTSHIYWPAGGLAMLGFAAGWGWLVWLATRRTPAPA